MLDEHHLSLWKEEAFLQKCYILELPARKSKDAAGEKIEDSTKQIHLQHPKVSKLEDSDKKKTIFIFCLLQYFHFDARIWL